MFLAFALLGTRIFDKLDHPRRPAVAQAVTEADVAKGAKVAVDIAFAFAWKCVNARGVLAPSKVKMRIPPHISDPKSRIE